MGHQSCALEKQDVVLPLVRCLETAAFCLLRFLLTPKLYLQVSPHIQKGTQGPSFQECLAQEAPLNPRKW